MFNKKIKIFKNISIKLKYKNLYILNQKDVSLITFLIKLK